MDEKNFDSGIKEYNIVDKDLSKFEKQGCWDFAIGLQMVDGLKPSKYLLDIVKDNTEGKIDDVEVEVMLKKYYSNKEVSNKKISDERECDLVSARIVQLISDDSFVLHPTSLKSIHKYLFDGIYDLAGKYRDYNFSKKEIILNDDTVRYFPYMQIEEALDYDFNEEREFVYSNKSISEVVRHIAKFTSRIWEIHPFCEGNTRTTAVLIVKYLRSLGYNIENDLFKENSIYFRNALVRSNYYNPSKNISSTDEYLIKFYENLLIGTNHELKSRDLMVKELFK